MNRMANLENTQYFNVKTAPEVRVKEVLDLVYNAMAEKGYNPVNPVSYTHLFSVPFHIAIRIFFLYNKYHAFFV